MRRWLGGLALLGLIVGAPFVDASPSRMIVLGIDGMDPLLLEQYMHEGVVPNFSKLAKDGSFMPLGTATPPQSPVAWSNFITGMDPGGHGLFDFLGLDRKTLLPFQSIARVEPGKRKPWALGKWRIPLDSEHTMLLRDGTAFWEILEHEGVATTVFRVPANYPPVETPGRSISGMGTPDMRGTPGTFTFFTDDPEFEEGPVPGGNLHQVRVVAHRVTGFLEGPPNGFREDSPRTRAEFEVLMDPEHPVAEIRMGEHRSVLRVGEWSEWIPFGFELVPGLFTVSGMSRFFLAEMTPHFRLYVSPVNIDPIDPAQKISTPDDYAPKLARAAGRFYTQEMPEDTKALSAHILTPSDFVDQSELVMKERTRLLDYELDRFGRQKGRQFLFFYFSSVDQRSHMLWRQMDPSHPFHDPDTKETLAHALRATYVELDGILGRVLGELDAQTTLMVMSDHGFAPFNRQANLNTWLEKHGYLAIENPVRRKRVQWLRGLDWSRTQAFAIGLNSLYLNVRGRERYGIVDPAERLALARKIAKELRAWKDAETGGPVVTQPALREEIYHGSHIEEAPDIIVGYARGYRSSWATTSGKVPELLLEDNDREWSGDHCMDSRTVPGILLTSRKLSVKSADLKDLPVTILTEFGIKPPEQMRGRSVF